MKEKRFLFLNPKGLSLSRFPAVNNSISFAFKWKSLFNLTFLHPDLSISIDALIYIYSNKIYELLIICQFQNYLLLLYINLLWKRWWIISLHEMIKIAQYIVWGMKLQLNKKLRKKICDTWTGIESLGYAQ